MELNLSDTSADFTIKDRGNVFETGSYQLPPQPGQSTLNVQFASFCSCVREAVGPGSRIPVRCLSCWFALVKGGGLAGEVPQSGENHFHHVRFATVFSLIRPVGLCALSCGAASSVSQFPHSSEDFWDTFCHSCTLPSPSSTLSLLLCVSQTSPPNLAK